MNLRKLSYVIIMGVLCIGMLSRCDDTITLPEITGEYPIVEVARPYFPGDSISNDSVRVELGYEFTPKTDGAFASITGQMPATGEFTVTLWDQTTLGAMGTWQIIFLEDQYQETFVDKINLVAGKTYMLTINTTYWYEFVSGDSVQVFPQTIGNVEINRFGMRETFIPAYPNSFSTTAMNGLVDFRFEPLQSE